MVNVSLFFCSKIFNFFDLHILRVIEAGFSLPPTPPSSTSSDSEGSLSPEREAASPKSEASGSENGTRRLNQAGRVLLTTKPLPDPFGSGSSRHPINSPLISYQPVIENRELNQNIILIPKKIKFIFNL